VEILDGIEDGAGGKHHEMPAHHLLEHYPDDYLTAAGLAAEKNSPLFRPLGCRGRKHLAVDHTTRQDAGGMIVPPRPRGRIAHPAWLSRLPSNRHHRPYANRGLSRTPSRWQRTKAHTRPKLYERRNDQLRSDQVERIAL
jgi:integrase/recombinase XerD